MNDFPVPPFRLCHFYDNLELGGIFCGAILSITQYKYFNRNKEYFLLFILSRSCISYLSMNLNYMLMLIFWWQSIANPVYLFQGIVLRRGAKGTGMKSVELALSMCDIVDIYGFTVDPGYKEW